jgi:hypothetical protein
VDRRERKEENHFLPDVEEALEEEEEVDRSKYF